CPAYAGRSNGSCQNAKCTIRCLERDPLVLDPPKLSLDKACWGFTSMPFCNPRHGRRWPFGFSFVLTTGKPDKTPDNFAWRIHEENLDRTLAAVPLASLAVLAVRGSFPPSSNATYDITTLAGKVASVNGTPGLQIRFSALIESEADTTCQEGANPSQATLPTPGSLLTTALDCTTVREPSQS